MPPPERVIPDKRDEEERREAEREMRRSTGSAPSRSGGRDPSEDATFFFDRADAGRRLGRALKDHWDGSAEGASVVLGIPRGGVEVAAEIARELVAPLDVVIPRKVGAPGNPELGLGAIAEGVRVLDERLIRALDVAPAYLEAEIAAQESEIRRRTDAYRQGRAPVGIEGRTAIVVDDGVATGGTDADGPADARATTPLRVLALDRLTSVRDYEDFTRARAGIGKASARRLFDGQREVVHVTIAAAGDAPVDPASGLFTALEAALADFGDPNLPVRVAVRELLLIVMSAGVHVLPDYTWDLIEPAVRSAALGTLGFARRELGQPAYQSEVVAAMQSVEGVDYIDVDVFGYLPGDVDPVQLATIAARLGLASRCVPARPARFVTRQYQVTTQDTLTSVANAHGLSLDELLRLNPGIGTGGTEPGHEVDLTSGQELVVQRGIRPAQLALLSPAVPETLILRRIP
jgi:predicted phosphoribosyltransferase